MEIKRIISFVLFVLVLFILGVVGYMIYDIFFCKIDIPVPELPKKVCDDDSDEKHNTCPEQKCKDEEKTRFCSKRF